MPIYEYRCTSCGFQKEFLQKLSDPLHTVCPECGKESFKKMLTAAGFQLKGSGWYATDFKNTGSKPKPAEAKSDTAKSGGDKSGADKAGGDKSGGDKAGGDSKAGSSADSKASQPSATA